MGLSPLTTQLTQKAAQAPARPEGIGEPERRWLAPSLRNGRLGTVPL